MNLLAEVVCGGSGGAFTIDGSDNAYYNTGNVGIGTSTPSSTLDVSGSANITGNLTLPGIEITDNDIRGDGWLDLFANTDSTDSIGWIELRTVQHELVETQSGLDQIIQLIPLAQT